MLADRGDWVHRDYEKVMRDLHASVDRAEALEQQIADRARSIGALQEEVHGLRRTHDELRDALAQREAALWKQEADMVQRNEAIAAKDREIQRRRGWRWWLRLPLVRLGVLDD